MRPPPRRPPQTDSKTKPAAVKAPLDNLLRDLERAPPPPQPEREPESPAGGPVALSPRDLAALPDLPAGAFDIELPADLVSGGGGGGGRRHGKSVGD